MNLNITYRHLEPTEALEAKIREKAKHLKKYFKGKVDVNWVCEVNPNEHICEIGVHAGHDVFHAHGTDKVLYKALDVAVKKMEAQLRKKYTKLKEKIHNHQGIDHLEGLTT